MKRMGETTVSASMDSEVKTEFTKCVNAVYFSIVEMFPALWQIKEDMFTTIDFINTTGTTAAGTAGSKIVTFSPGGGAFAFPSSAYNGYKIRKDGATRYFTLYDVDVNSARLTAPLDEAWSAETVDVYNDLYRMPFDMIEMLHMKDLKSGREIIPKFPVEMDDIDLYRNLSGSSYYYIPTGINSSSTYSSSTVTVTNNSATVTLAAGAFPADIVYHVFRLKRESKWYRVRTRTDDTNIQLDEVYTGASGASLTYEIDPPGSWNFALYPIPDALYTIYIKYYAFPRLLEADNDRPFIIPEVYHEVIWNGAICYKLEYEEETDGKLYTQCNNKFREGVNRLKRRFKPEARSIIKYASKYDYADKQIDRWKRIIVDFA